MTNVDLLETVIERSGLKKTFIAKSMGLSYQGFLNKIRGENEFKQGEIDSLSRILRLNSDEKEAMFFAHEVA